MGGGERGRKEREGKRKERGGEERGMDENERRVGDVARIRGREETPGLCPVNACPSIIACTPHLALLLCFVFLLCHYFVLFLSRIIVVFVTFLGCFGVFYVWKFFSQ